MPRTDLGRTQCARQCHEDARAGFTPRYPGRPFWILELVEIYLFRCVSRIFDALSYSQMLLGSTLMRRYRAAVKDRNIQVESHWGLTAVIPQEVVEEWEKMCEVWDGDVFPKTATNPYECLVACKSSSIMVAI